MNTAPANGTLKYFALVFVFLVSFTCPLQTSAAILIKFPIPSLGCQVPTCATRSGVREFQCWPMTPCDPSNRAEVQCNGSSWTLSYHSPTGICPTPKPALSLSLSIPPPYPAATMMQFRGKDTNSCGRLLGSYFTVDCSTDECPTLPVCAEACPQGATGKCDFYSTCVEATIPCGPNGYALAFGEHYCDMYMASLADFTDLGQEWVLSVALCLQQALLPTVRAPSATCANITEAALASHVQCYVKPTNDTNVSICRLPVNDWLLIMRIVGSAIFSDEWLSVLAQMFATLERCMQNQTGLLHLSPTGRDQIAHRPVRMFTIYLSTNDSSNLLLEFQTLRAVQAALQTIVEPAPITVFVAQHPTSASEGPMHVENSSVDTMSLFTVEGNRFIIRLDVLLLPNDDSSGDASTIIHNSESDLINRLRSQQMMPMMVYLPSGKFKFANLTDFTIAEVRSCDAIRGPCFSTTLDLQ